MATDRASSVPAPVIEELGVFLATNDAPRLIAWYAALGIPLGEEGYCTIGGSAPGDGGVFSIMPATTTIAPNPSDDLPEEPYGRRRATLNLRVNDLDAVTSGLRKRGDKVAGPKDFGYGVFAWVKDPDGNLVELWQRGTPPA